MLVLRPHSYHLDASGLLARVTRAIVSSVFEHTWHLRTVDGWIVSVTTAPHNGPLAIRLDRATLADLPVRPGMAALFSDGMLAIGPVRLDLAGATVWHPTPRAVPLDRDLARRDLVALTECVSAIEPAPPFRQRTQQISRALATGDPGEVALAAYQLLGLGAGLTPEGDDILCGLLAGLAVLAPISSVRESIAAVRLALDALITEQAPARTSALSRTLLHYASRGVALQPLLDVLCTLGSGAVSGSDALLAVGHSSGRAMLSGACLAATVILGWEERGAASLAGSPEYVP